MARFVYQDTFDNGSDLTAYIDENSLNPEVFLTDEFILRDANDAGVTFAGSGFTYGSGGIPSDGMVTFFFAFDDTGAPLLTVSDFSLNLGTLATTYLTDGLDAVGVNLSAGRDTFIGSVNNDQINAGAGRDRIFGGAGADTINGERGDDVIRGNGGPDHFVFRQGTGTDTIMDFRDLGGSLDDRIVMRQADFDVMVKSDHADGVHLEFGANATFILANIMAVDIGREDFILI